MNPTTSPANHIFHPTLLRAYDIRGVYGTNLLDQDAYALGRTFGAIVARETGKQDWSIVVGYDGRHSSAALEAALLQGLREAGGKILRVGLGPTPLVYFTSFHQHADAAIMITGSHNPAEYNGFKLMLSGKPFFGEALQTLGAEAAHMLPPIHAQQQDMITIATEAVQAYQQFLLQTPLYSNPNLTIAWDPGNGATGDIVAALVKAIPGKHFVINANIDGDFPAHDPDPTVVANLTQLKAEVLAHQCDIGIAFDGDGDRVSILDSQGRMVWGDQLLSWLAADILEAIPGATIITDVKVSDAVIQRIGQAGGVPIIWKTGHSHIKAKMAETHAVLGGEMSGHIFFKDRYEGYDDGLYAAMRILEIIAKGQSTPAMLIDSFSATYDTKELKIAVDDTLKFEVIARLSEWCDTQRLSYLAIDGVRAHFPGGWWLIRASNTQPSLILRCEAATEADFSYGLKQMRTALAESSGIDFTHEAYTV